MKFNLMSDIHFEGRNVPFLESPFPSPENRGDVLLLAGDIIQYNLLNLSHSYPFTHFYNFIEEASLLYDKVFMVFGNHEYYDGVIGKAKAAFDQFFREYGFVNCHTLDDEYVELQPGLFLYGTTLWTDFNKSPTEEMRAQFAMNDYTYIQADSKESVKFLTSRETAELHASSYAKFVDFLEKHPDDKVMLLCHHAPSYLSLSDADSYYSAAYASELTGLYYMSNLVGICHGHTHHCVEYELTASCVVRSNPVGYVDEFRSEYNPNFVFSV